MREPPPFPTPYDITDIPAFPFVPQWQHWLLVLAALSAAMLIAHFWVRRSDAVGRHELDTQQVKARLKDLLVKVSSGGDEGLKSLFAASLLVRRKLSLDIGEDLTCRSAAEIEDLFKLKVMQNPELTESLLDLERLKYGRHDWAKRAAALESCIKNL